MGYTDSMFGSENLPEPDPAPAAPGTPGKPGERGGRRWVRRGLLALIVIPIVGWLGLMGATHLVLSTEWGHDLLNRRPEKLRIDWTRAESPSWWRPGEVEVEGLVVAGRSRRLDWEIHLREGRARIDLPALLVRRFEASGFRGRGLEVTFRRRAEEGPPSPAHRPPWTLEFEDFAIEEVETLAAGNLELTGSGRAWGSFRFEIRGPLELSDFHLDAPGFRLRVSGETAAEFSRLKLELASTSFSPREHPGVSSLAFFRGGADLAGEVASLDFLDYYLSRTPWLSLEGSGVLAGHVTFDAGRLLAPTHLEVRAPNLAAEFLDYTAEGAAGVELAVAETAAEGDAEEDAEGEGAALAPAGRLTVAFDDFTVRREGLAVPHVRGTGFRLTGTSPELALSRPFEDLTVTVDLPPSEVPDLTLYNAWLPPETPVAFRAGSGRIDGTLKMSTRDDSGTGRLRFQARQATMAVGEGRYRGDLEVVTRLQSRNLRQRRFDLAGSQLRLSHLQELGRGAPPRSPEQLWWGEMAVTEAALTWQRPFTLDARLTARIRDSGPLLSYFIGHGRLAGRFESVLRLEDIAGVAHLEVDPKAVTLDSLEIATGELTLLARLRLARGLQKGLFYAHYKRLEAGLAIDDGERDLRLIRPREWYDHFPDWP